MPDMSVAQCEQLCYDQYCNDLEHAKEKATRHFLFFPYTDGDVFDALASNAKDKYKRCLDLCKG